MLTLYAMNDLDNQTLVIFGASGDLTRRKLIPALFQLYLKNLLPDKFSILGIGRTKYDDASFREHLGEAIAGPGPKSGERDRAKDFLRLIHYLSIDTSDPEDYGQIKQKLDELDRLNGTGFNRIYYLATPPQLYETIARNLSLQKMARNHEGWRRIIVEKPFGSDLASARQLNLQLLQCFSEDQIYRIDHYLGKESVQNVMVTRFSNGIFEPLWNRNYIQHVEVTSAESLGIENRGGYYDQAGALRDMVQNHLLQLVALVAMEPPTRIQSNAIRNETLKVLQSVRPFSSAAVRTHVIRGQYTRSVIRDKIHESYREEPEVAADSRTETYVALKLYIDNWRWGNVPFYIRTGKRLPTRVTEIVVHFKPSPHPMFCFGSERFSSGNQLVIRIQPDEGILIKFGMKVPGSGFQVQEVNMDFHYADLGEAEIPEAYQRLLLDCMQGDSTLFTRGDAVEQSWDIIDPIHKGWELHPEIPIYGYPAGTWGPEHADLLIEGEHNKWRYPCKNLDGDGIFCEL